MGHFDTKLQWLEDITEALYFEAKTAANSKCVKMCAFSHQNVFIGIEMSFLPK
jgi:hypothetical protein